MRTTQADGSLFPTVDLARDVRDAYMFFDERRVRGEPFDEADMQNIHQWMRLVTEFIERQAKKGPLSW